MPSEYIGILVLLDNFIAVDIQDNQGQSAFNTAFDTGSCSGKELISFIRGLPLIASS